MTTAYCYDDLFLKHDLAGHPETADRLRAIMAHLSARGLLERVTSIEPEPATEAQLGRFHTQAYIDRVRHLAERGGGYLDPDTYTNSYSFSAALLASGALVKLTRAIVTGDVTNGFALVRPPGHHAIAGRGMGFCIFNNIVIAALEALEAQDVEKVMIYDFDVHHGNGTQAAFEEDPRVLFFSSHQFPHYPGTGPAGDVGRGPGIGTIVNIPLPPGTGDEGYARVLAEIAWPLARRYQPDLVLVSAGFDAHWSDPLAMMALSLQGYATIARELVTMADELCDGRIVFTLEGGYDRTVLAHGVENVFHALLGDREISDPIGPAPSGERPVDARIAEIRRIHGLV